MIFNCLQCGKAVSSRLDVCPYCKLILTDIAEVLQGNREYKELALRAEYKGTIFGSLLKAN